jgi:hypothetical protein
MSALPHKPRRIQIEELDGGVMVARFVGNDLGLFGREDAPELFELVERADRDPGIRAVVFTGSHPNRFISHADLQWLQQDGSVIPPVGRRLTSVVARVAHQFGRNKLARWVASKTPLMGAVQLDHMHETLVRMTTSSTGRRTSHTSCRATDRGDQGHQAGGERGWIPVDGRRPAPRTHRISGVTAPAAGAGNHAAVPARYRRSR